MSFPVAKVLLAVALVIEGRSPLASASLLETLRKTRLPQSDIDRMSGTAKGGGHG